MARSIHVWLDDESEAALRRLRGLPGVRSDPDAVRRALRDAGELVGARASLRVEAADLVADPDDVAEARQVLELMSELAGQ